MAMRPHEPQPSPEGTILRAIVGVPLLLAGGGVLALGLAWIVEALFGQPIRFTNYLMEGVDSEPEIDDSGLFLLLGLIASVLVAAPGLFGAYLLSKVTATRLLAALALAVGASFLAQAGDTSTSWVVGCVLAAAGLTASTFLLASARPGEKAAKTLWKFGHM